MSTPSQLPLPDSAATRRLYLRTAALLGLLLAEVIAFSLCFDVQPLQTSSTLIGRPFGYGAVIFRVLAVATIAIFAIGRHQWPDTFRRWALLAAHDRTFGWACAVHLIAATAFALISTRVLQPNGPAPTSWQTSSWILTGGLALVAWLLAMAPARFWREWWEGQSALLLAAGLSIGLAVNFAGLYTRELWIPLSDLTLATCERLLSFVSNDVVCDPASRVLGTREFRVQIAPVCSGYEGIGLIVTALTLWMILFRAELRFPQALLLLPIGIGVVWMFNALRIVALILVGAHLSPTVAVNGFHSQAGWIAFVVLTLAISAAALRSPWFSQHKPPSLEAAPNAARSNSTAYLMPLMAMIAAAMVAGLFSAGFDRLYPLRVVAGLAALWYYRTAFTETSWSWSWMAIVNGVVVFILWIALTSPSPSGSTPIASGLGQMTRFWEIAWLACRVLGSVLVAPLAEELAFRGYLMRRFMGRDFEGVSYHSTSWLAVAISSLLFGLLAGHWLAGSLAGLAYALAARRRDKLCDAIIAHAATNGAVAAYVLWTHSWYSWE